MRKLVLLHSILFASIVGSFVASVPLAAQQQKLCCPCKSPQGSRVIAETAPFANACPIACTSNGDKPTQEAPWIVSKEVSCLAPRPQPAQPPKPDLVASIKYAIGHQGARVWTGGLGVQSYTGEKLRASLTGVDMDARTLRTVPIGELEKAVPEAAAQCISDRNIDKDFAWVCRAKGHDGEITILLSQGKFDNIRSVFSNTQADDDQLRNRIYCRNNQQIAELVHNHCP